ncbi:peptidase M28, partial [Enterococcus faecalis]
LGSIIAKNVGDKEGPKVYISGHMNEVGFMVTQITEKGFLKFQTVGGWWWQVMLAQQVQIKTTSGRVYHGVIDSKPPDVITAKVRNK